MEKLKFKPTKQWIKDHKYHPDQCPDKECYCILDHINKHSQGFCTGIKLNSDNDLDIISLCENFYRMEGGLPHQRYLFHPNEAQLLATYLSFAVISAWEMLPNHRQQLGNMSRQRTRLIHEKDKVE